MARLALGAFVAVLVLVAALPLRSHLTAQHEIVTSTPSDYTGLDHPFELPGNGVACADEILFDTGTRIARFSASAKRGDPAPSLRIEARGYPEGPYRTAYASSREVPGGWKGLRTLEVPLQPPRSAAFGTFCVRNLEKRAIDLVGTEDGRAGSRPTVAVNGTKIELELKLRLLAPGRSSYLARAGQIMDHASTLRPFGAWWWWLLTLAVVTLAPLGVGLAIRSALPVDAPAVVRPAEPARPWPSDRVRRIVESVPGWAMVAAVGTVACLWFLYYGVHTHVFQNDEDQYVYLSRWFKENLPGSLWDFDTYQRGLQRLEIWLLAVPQWVADSPWSLVGGRLLNTVAFVSTAIPVYLLARGQGLSSRWAALPAGLTVVVPWAVVTTSFLTENVAYPASMWVVWAIWLCATRPGASRDLLALALAFVAGLSRSALLVLAPVLPLVVLGTSLRCEAGPLTARFRAALRGHSVLWTAVAAGALVLLAGALRVGEVAARLAGAYGTSVGVDLFTMLSQWGRYVSRAVLGTGFLTAAVALPWLVGALARSRDPGRFAFGLTVVAGAVALLYSLNHAGADERYILYLAPLLLLPASVALARREVSAAGLAIASVALAALLIAVPWDAAQGPFSFFVSPVETFYTHEIGQRLDRDLPGGLHAALTVAALGLAAAGVALAVVLRREPSRLVGRPTALLVAAVAFAMVMQTEYALDKHVNGVGSKSGQGLRARAFVDELVPKGASVGEFLEGVGQDPSLFGVWQEVQFYNQRLDRVFAAGENVNPVPIGDSLVQGLGIDARTGRVHSPEPLPDYLVIPTPVGSFRLRGEILRAQTYIPVALLRLAHPATASWSARGFAADGSLADPDGATVRVYGTGLPAGHHCAAFEFATPPNAPASWRLIRDRAEVGSGRVAAGATGSATVALDDLVQRGFADIRVSGPGVRVTGINVDAGC